MANLSLEHRKKISEGVKKNLPSSAFKKGNHPKTEFKKGHLKSTLAYKFGKGRKHPKWKGGKYLNHGGYVLILKPKHPFSNYQGYIFKHRLVMEKHLRRYLKDTEVVHHKNENPSDNRISNLMLFSNNGEHRRFHRKNKCQKHL